jgi:hypothetical protein
VLLCCHVMPAAALLCRAGVVRGRLHGAAAPVCYSP